MSDPSHQSSPVAISFGTAFSQGQFHPGHRAESGMGIWLVEYSVFRLQDVPVQSRKDSVGQQVERGTEYGTDIFSVLQMIWHH